MTGWIGLMLLSPALAPGQPAGDGALPTDYTLHPPVHREEIDRGPRRIISIAPSITELCAALGLADRIVGRTQYCTHPPSVQHTDIVGAYADTNLEKIIALKPEIILITDSSPKLREQLEGLRLPFATVPDSTLEDIYTAADRLGRLLERPRTARRLIDHLKHDLERLSERRQPRPLKVLFTFSPMPAEAEALYVAGPGGYLDSLLQLAGYRNAMSTRLQREWGKVSVETILEVAPDYILEVRPPERTIDPENLYRGWAVLSGVPAIRHRRIRSLQSTAIAKPGPRINLALHEIITVLSGPQP